ncbi:Lipase [Gryllus bimaculatus]|nr:Lipase [Gryllus bimaculatus]
MHTKHSHGHLSDSNHFSSVAKSGRAEFRAEARGERVPSRRDHSVARMHARPAARVALVGLALALAGGAAAQPPPGLGPDVLGLLAGLRPAKAEDRVRRWGYPFETHTVRTEDGFLLTAHRIPRGRGGGAGGEGGETNAVGDGVSGTGARPPVILQHGMMACSEYFVLGGPDMAPGEFRQMDHGAKENLRRYGSLRPPAYPLANVTAPVLIFATAGDAIVTLEAVDRLVKILPNVVETKVIREKFFNHMDFAYHQRLNELVTEPALEVMARF